MADTRIIAIDDKIIFFQKTDLPKDLQGDVELLLQNYSGGYVPNLSSKADVVLSGSARLTVSEVARIEAILLPINQRSVHIDAVKYADRLAPVVAARLAEMQFVTYSDSSGSFEEVRADTGPDANNLDETSTTQGLRHLLDLGEADLSQHFVYGNYPFTTSKT